MRVVSPKFPYVKYPLPNFILFSVLSILKIYKFCDFCDVLYTLMYQYCLYDTPSYNELLLFKNLLRF